MTMGVEDVKELGRLDDHAGHVPHVTHHAPAGLKTILLAGAILVRVRRRQVKTIVVGSAVIAIMIVALIGHFVGFVLPGGRPAETDDPSTGGMMT